MNNYTKSKKFKKKNKNKLKINENLMNKSKIIQICIVKKVVLLKVKKNIVNMIKNSII